MSTNTPRVSIEMDQEMSADKARELVEAIATALLNREAVEIECVYQRQWDAAELVRLERQMTKIVRSITWDCFKVRIAKRWRMRFDMANFHHIPDGKPDDKNIVIRFDIPKLMGITS